MIKIEDIDCYSCEAKAIVPAGRAKWVCRECGKDNSVYVVLLYKAANPTKRKAKHESVRDISVPSKDGGEG